MRRLNPEKLHVRFIHPTREDNPIHPRFYTLTHSDRTGELFLTIGNEYDKQQISGWYTRLMRDEVLAEWKQIGTTNELHVLCEVERGFGWTSMRESIFRRELRLVFEAFRYGDRALFDKYPNLDSSKIMVHFLAKRKKNDRIEGWGNLSDYT